MPTLCIGTDAYNELDRGHEGQEAGSPRWRTFFAGRQVSAMGIGPRKAKAHWQNGDATRVIELIPGHAHPRAQTIPAGIVEGLHAGACVRSGRLSRNTQASAHRRL